MRLLAMTLFTNRSCDLQNLWNVVRTKCHTQRTDTVNRPQYRHYVYTANAIKLHFRHNLTQYNTFSAGMIIIPATNRQSGNIVPSSFVRTFVRMYFMYVCNNFTVYALTRKILQRSALFFVGTLGTLGQYEFAFGFCGSTQWWAKVNLKVDN